MKDKQQILSLFENNGRLLRRLGVMRIGLFGSVARGDATRDSDVDVLVEDSARTDEMSFMTDECRQRAYARSLEIIGEAAQSGFRAASKRPILKSIGRPCQECGTS